LTDLNPGSHSKNRRFFGGSKKLSFFAAIRRSAFFKDSPYLPRIHAESYHFRLFFSCRSYLLKTIISASSMYVPIALQDAQQLPASIWNLRIFV
jgi:hypothetical protein